MEPVVKGFAKGYAKIIREIDHNQANQNIKVDSDTELLKLTKSIDYVRESIQVMIGNAQSREDSTMAAIMEVHKMLLEDDALISEMKSTITSGKGAYESIEDVFDTWIQTFESMDNEYMKERSTDLKDIKTSLLNAVINGADTRQLYKQNILDDIQPIVLFTPELTPSQLASMNVECLRGIVTKKGGFTSHAAIMCKTLDIPMLVHQYSDEIQENTLVLVDCITGNLVSDPSDHEQNEFRVKQLKFESFKEKVKSSRENVHLANDILQVNVGDLDDLHKAIEVDASGVGLFRTEFLFMKSKTVPTENEQYESYRKILESFGDHPVTIRTIDIGGDKNLPYLKMGEEENPFLGYRAIRICLNTHQDLFFRDQLRAILRASHYGKARIMFPMIANSSEIRKAKTILDEEMQKLDAENIPYDADIQVGIMIEIPSAALLAHSLAKHVDFFSIGTNDLTQYTMAADRMNEKVAYLYSYFEPAVLSLIDHVIGSAISQEVDVSVCGEMASDPLAIPLLSAMGLKKYSVSSSRVDATRYILKSLSKENKDRLRGTLLDYGLDREEILDKSKNIHG